MEPSQFEIAVRKLSERADEYARHQTPAPLRESLGDKDVICEHHGAYISTGMRYMGRREIWTHCPDCDEAFKAAERKAEAEKKAEAARRQMEFRIGQAMIPARFVGRTLDTFKASNPGQRAALSIANEYARDFVELSKKGESLVFFGLPGTGKSHLAVGILQAVMPAYQGLYLTCMGMIRAVRNTWRRDSERSESEVLMAYADVDLLVIDEVGVQYGTDGEQTILFDVLDRRYREMKPTILLSNQDVKGMREFLGDRTMDRLSECARFVPCQWESYRPQARKEAA